VQHGVCQELGDRLSERRTVEINSFMNRSDELRLHMTVVKWFVSKCVRASSNFADSHR
jgi:hypothetical protein